MTDTQPVEATPATPAAEAQAPAPQESQAPAPTAAQVEAEYKARLSGKDKAHAAEVAELRRQLDTAQSTSTSTATEAAQKDQTVEQLQAQLKQAYDTNQQQRQDFDKTIRSTKYPNAAEALDPQTLATMDEGKLAGLDARLKPSPTPAPVDPNTPPADAAPKPQSEKTTDELKADLARESAAFAQQLNARE